MNILVIGSGGREHALCWKIRQNSDVKNLYCIPGNAGTDGIADNYNIDILDSVTIKAFCVEKKVDLVIVGPELPLARGITDALENAGIKVSGPSYGAARMESSKIFAKEFMGRYDIPTARFRIFDDFKKAEEYIKYIGAPLVVKVDGLAGGKGVIVAMTTEEAISAAKSMLDDKIFGSAGNKIIVEEFLKGEEVSILAFSDGKNIIPLETSQDHKRIYEGDHGPNTGGMGAYSPAPVVNDVLMKEIEKVILKPTIDGMREEGMPYKGVIYAGLMLTKTGPKVLEFNVRFGDPEAQALIPRVKSDIVDIMLGTANGDISGKTIEWDKRYAVCVVISSSGYPGEYEKDKLITGIEDAEREGVFVFHAGTKKENGKIYSNGGRVLNVVALGDTIEEARHKVYSGVEKINFEGMYYRKDIAHRFLEKKI
ncbi:phosphoribosylamine/glycine ligase [Candidatus Omnitrophus magneticus]|uniref:Phosphoribosylamine--glycine ligase n=1 Tax=Candidatus Omnitrophus magneticus TaxID=1609969 RepID=A0A0F0CP20_9BACT|nr:phosphoribosylamine/glycine ligase [Candidatus Omnitrophus magneticus]